MKFIDRELELEELKRIYNLSKKRIFPILIFGARRIGKTRLVEEFCKDKKFLYFFVYEGKGVNSLLREFEKELKEKNVIKEYRNLASVEEFVQVLFKECKDYVVVFDEVQSFLSIYKAFFSLIQREIDSNERNPGMFIFLGSVVGLIKKVFEDLKSPLYGRMKHELLIKPLKYKDIRKIFPLLGYKEKKAYVEFYAIFGGFPKYYVALEDYQLKNIDIIHALEFLFFRENAPLKNEIMNILRQEFGKGKTNYYDILEAIATGHTKLNEIATYVGKHQTDITPFIRDLIEYYEIIKRETIVTENPRKTRNSVYLIKAPLIRFWFRFVYPNLRYLELNEFDFILKKVKKELNSYIGYGFEEVCRQFIVDFKGFSFELVGKWWGYKRKKGKREPLEIDSVALNKDSKDILFGECKWQENVNAENILEDLIEKAEHVHWYNDKRKESYALFAKSFKKKVKEFEGKKVHCFDLKDIEKILKKKN